LEFGGEVAVDVGGDLDAAAADDFADCREGYALSREEAGAIVEES
jgi:hypothetical protein